jgi:hypothetical protein
MRLKYLGVVAVLLFASAARGDGCYIAERAVRKIPAIPAQRAILSWKDGIETLVISSALDSEAQKLGWIIPIPTVPQAMEEASPGGLKSLDFCIQPKITHDLYLGVKAAIGATLIANLIMGTFLFKRPWFARVTILVFVAILLQGLMLSAGAGISTATKAENLRVEKSATVGSYDISVLKAPKSDELKAWLATNGFSSLPAAADKIVANYIAKGWVFAAIKLTRIESGTNAPHPIKMVFVAKEAVYPMRLTAIAGGSPRFELFVIGDDSTSCDLLEEEFCDRFKQIGAYQGEGYETRISCDGVTTHQVINHPAICSLMWDKCVLTKFAGTINANDMTGDLRFDWKPFEACQRYFYTISGARDFAMILFIALTGSWCFATMILCNGRIMQPGGFWRYLGQVLFPAIAIFGLGAGIAFASVPKLGDSEVEISRGRWRQYRLPMDLRIDIQSLLDKHREILRGTDREIADYILKSLKRSRIDGARARETITGTELAVEDSPGNFTVEKRHNKVLIRVYDRYGGVLLAEYPILDQAKHRIKP